MTYEQFQEKLADGVNANLISFIGQYSAAKGLEEVLKQYDPKLHRIVVDKTFRRDKLVEVPGKDGDPDHDIPPTPGKTDRVPVARLALPIQKKIVLTAAAFLGTPEMEANPKTPEEENFLAIMEKIWDDNKLDWKFKQLAKRVKSEKECAELWYSETAPEGYWEDVDIRKNEVQISTMLIGPSYGDKLYPVFDDMGKLIAFGREYKTKDDDAKDITHYDIYTKDRIYEATQANGLWTTKDSKNFFSKIPIIYYSQPITDWEDVQPLIERLETKISNHADTNDYFDSPIVVATGEVEGFANKGEAGKLLEAEPDAKVEYLTWNQAPESTRMEIENLIKFIYQFTHTPDISFESMKGLGVFSGIALKMLFLDAHLKAADSSEIFGEGLQRRINFMKHSIITLDPDKRKVAKMKITPKFEFYLPQDDEALVATLIAAVAAGIMTKETAVRMNPFVLDPEAEIAALQAVVPAAGAVDPVTGLPTGGAGVPAGAGSDNIGKIPLAIQQLGLALARANEAGDTELAGTIKAQINRLLAKLGSDDQPAA